jgi:hypothetical protein
LVDFRHPGDLVLEEGDVLGDTPRDRLEAMATLVATTAALVRVFLESIHTVATGALEDVLARVDDAIKLSHRGNLVGGDLGCSGGHGTRRQWRVAMWVLGGVGDEAGGWEGKERGTEDHFKVFGKGARGQAREVYCGEHANPS